jgi:large subunit ribosomal protein L18
VFAKTLKDAGINEVTFDRNGFLYHGVVKAFAETLRANEIKF